MAYVGTHDNETAMGWFKDTATPDVREKTMRYLALGPGETVAQGCNRAIAASVRRHLHLPHAGSSGWITPLAPTPPRPWGRTGAGACCPTP